MRIRENENAKIKYKYELYRYDELTHNQLKLMLLAKSGSKDKKHAIRKRLKSYTIGRGKYNKGYFDITFSFDIETTTVTEPSIYATMYIWQAGINNHVIYGRYWWEFIELLQRIKDIIKPTQNQRLLCLIHNLNYELSFMRKWLNITDSFLKDQRTPLYVEHDNFIVFQDSYALTNMSLKKLAETYCNTQKCENDLNYNLKRHNTTPITDIELSYCANDVLILNEFSDYFYNTFFSQGVKPLTSTGILNKEVQDGFKLMSDTYKRYIELAHPENFDLYMWFMSEVYRGGFVHGNELFIGELFTEEDNIEGYDITSSYPASMLYKKYPYKFRKSKITALEEIEKYIEKDYAVCFKITFYGINRTTLHSIESKSKCTYVSANAGIDNGRIACGDITVSLTEQDYLSYKEFYTWKSYKLEQVYISRKEYLPRYLLDPLCKYGSAKQKLKHEGKDGTVDYSIAKSRFNLFYGLCVKMLPTLRVVLDNDGWHLEDGTPYEKNKTNGLLPYFGIYISAYSRRALLSMIYKLESNGYKCLYADTDSIKVLNADAASQKIFDDYNAEIKKLTREAKERLQCGNFIDGLGEYDKEYGEGTKHGKVSHFKMLGAKRYMISTVTGYNNQTIAGLPKNELFNLYDIDTAYEMFEDDLEIKDTKLRASYIDEGFEFELTDYTGETRTVTERSAVALVPSDFTLNINEMWLQDILNLKLDERYYYNRGLKND